MIFVVILIREKPGLLLLSTTTITGGNSEDNNNNYSNNNIIDIYRWVSIQNEGKGRGLWKCYVNSAPIDWKIVTINVPT